MSEENSSNMESTAHKDVTIRHTDDANNTIQFLIYGLFIAGLGVSFYNNTWSIALPVGGTALISFLIARNFFRNQLSYVTSFSLGLLASQLIFQIPEFPQLNILFFIIAAALVFFIEWQVFIPLFIIFVIHHIIFGFITTAAINEQLKDTGVYLAFFPLQILLEAIATIKLKDIKFNAIDLAERFTEQSKNLEQNLFFAREIAAGNFDTENNAASNDVLGQSLKEMSKNLKVAAEEDKNRNWSIVGISQVAEIIRASNHNIDELSNKLVSYLVNYLGATQGAIFVLSEEENNLQSLELKGCYAYERRKFIQKKVEIGEGLLGQAVLEQDTVYLTDIPQNYLTIASGLGDSNPNSIVIVPLKTEDDVVGAMEIASFKKFEKHQREFLEKVSETIAASIVFSKTNSQTTKLLEESQILAEQLGAQEEEMRQNMEELQATQEDIQRKNLEMEKAGEELNRTKDFLDAIINAIPNPVFVKDQNLKMIIVNDAYCELNNVDRSEILSKTNVERNSKKESGDLIENERTILREDKVVVNEEEFVNAKGATQSIVTTKAPFSDKEGNKYIIGSIMDISRQKDMQKALAKEKYLMEALMTNTTDDIYFKDMESKFIRVSNNMSERFGAKIPDELVGKSDFDFFTQDHAQPAYDGEQEIIRTGVPIIDLVEKETWDDGRETFVSTTKMTLKDLEGNLIGTFGTSRDVTKSILTEQELIKKEKLYQTLFQYTSEISTIIDVDGKIRYKSPSFYRIFGMKEEDVLGKSIFDIVHKEDLSGLEKAIVNAKKSEGNIEEATVRLKNAENKWIPMKSIIHNLLEDELIKGIIINSKQIE